MKEKEKLVGDQVEELLELIGADKLATAFEDISDGDCGCGKRKEWLNKTHQRIKDAWNNFWGK